MRTQDEIEEQIEEAEMKDFSGMSYSEGVKNALEWVLEYVDEKPMED